MIGKKIRKLRILNRISQKELAEKLGVSQRTVSRWEREETEPSASQLKNISKVFNIDLHRFIMDEVFSKDSAESEFFKEYQKLKTMGGDNVMQFLTRLCKEVQILISQLHKNNFDKNF